jgi:mannose-6-phosphate isomerase-like protein (cupin superfamily)
MSSAEDNNAKKFTAERKASLGEGLEQLPGVNGERFVKLFEHGSLLVEVYAPRGTDPQKPHTRDEAYIVARGTGEFVNGETRVSFEAGDFLFAAAGEVHRFENFTDDFAVWVLFYGPEGGERTGYR